MQFAQPDEPFTLEHLRDAHRFNPIIGTVTELAISPSRIEVVAVTPLPCPIEGAPGGSFAHYYVELAFNRPDAPRDTLLYMAFGCWLKGEWQATTVQRLHTTVQVFADKTSNAVYAAVATAVSVQEQHVVIEAVQQMAPPATEE